MRLRVFGGLAGAIALAVPATAVAGSEIYYDQHPNALAPRRDVQILINPSLREVRDIEIHNPCLPPNGLNPYDASKTPRVQLWHLHLSGSKFTYNGLAKEPIVNNAGRDDSRMIRVTLSAFITPQHVTGIVRFPTIQKCGTIHFTAKLSNYR